MYGYLEMSLPFKRSDLKCWKRVKYLAIEFWKRCIMEYSQLFQHYKWLFNVMDRLIPVKDTCL